MSSAMRITRSLLFTPGDRLSAVNKALAMKSLDFVVIDLEDAISTSSKVTSRDALVKFLSNLPSRATYPKIMVRVNCPSSTPFGASDLEALSPHFKTIDALLFPKVESPHSITQITNHVHKDAPSPPIWCMIETARGIQSVNEISQHASVQGLVVGTNDLSKDLRSKMMPDRSPLIYSLSRTVLAARAAGKLVIDGVFMDLNDESGLQAEARQGRVLGFDGKSLIHPKQVDAANTAFTPSHEDVAEARAIVDIFGQAQKDGKGVCVYQGKLIEALHVEQALETVLLHDALTNR